MKWEGNMTSLVHSSMRTTIVLFLHDMGKLISNFGCSLTECMLHFDRGIENFQNGITPIPLKMIVDVKTFDLSVLEGHRLSFAGKFFSDSEVKKPDRFIRSAEGSHFCGFIAHSPTPPFRPKPQSLSSVAQIWRSLSSHVSEGRDVYNNRYKSIVSCRVCVIEFPISGSTFFIVTNRWRREDENCEMKLEIES